MLEGLAYEARLSVEPLIDFYGLDGPVGTALLGRKVRFETPRYDDEPVQQDRRAQSFQGQTSGAPNLVDFISNIFSP